MLQLKELSSLFEEKIKQLKAGGAERRGEVEGKRDLLVEKVKDAVCCLQKKLETAEERKQELERKVGNLEIENDKLVKGEKFLSQTLLKNSGEKLKKSKESEDVKENDNESVEK